MNAGSIGGSGNSKLSALWFVDPGQATTIVSRAIVHHEGNLSAVAKELNVSRSRLYVWIQRSVTLSDLMTKIEAQRVTGGQVPHGKRHRNWHAPKR